MYTKNLTSNVIRVSKIESQFEIKSGILIFSDQVRHWHCITAATVSAELHRFHCILVKQPPHLAHCSYVPGSLLSNRQKVNIPKH